MILSRTLSYSKASEHLYVSQSILSRHIADMEKELGVKLLQRSTHEVSLTSAGQKLAASIPSLLEQQQDLMHSMHADPLFAQGSVRIACVLEFAYSSHLQNFFRRFKEKYPDIMLDIDIRTEGLPQKLTEDYDIIFSPCEYIGLPDYVLSRKLGSHNTYVCLYPGHPLLSRPQIQLRDLADETILVPFADELFGPYAQNFQLVQKYTHNRAHAVPVRNLVTALTLVSIGSGIAIVPRYAKYLLPQNAFLVPIISRNSHFGEYMYLNSSRKNDAAVLFHDKLISSLFPET